MSENESNLSKDDAYYRNLMMGLMDGELTPEEAVEINDHLMRNRAAREEYDELCRSSGKLEAMVLGEPGDKVLRGLWRSPVLRLFEWLVVALMLGGYLTLVGYAMVSIVQDDHEGLSVKLITFAILGGITLLLLLTVWRQWLLHRVDPYKDIER